MRATCSLCGEPEPLDRHMLCKDCREELEERDEEDEPVALLPTPNTMDWLPPRPKAKLDADRKAGKGGFANLREAVLYDLPAAEAVQ
jgi:hypothetical protein